MTALITVVEARRYSRNSGATSADSEIGTPGSSSARIAPIRCSWSPLTYEWSRQTATDSTPSRFSRAAAARADASSRGTSTSPVGPRRSTTPTARSRHERLRLLELRVVERGAHLARDLEQIAEAFRGHEAAARDLALDDRVRGDRRRVHDEADLRRLDVCLCERPLDGVHEALRRVGRRR